MTDDPSPLGHIRVGPYTQGYYAQCVDCCDTSQECATPGAALTWLAKHLRDLHPLATIDRT